MMLSEKTQSERVIVLNEFGRIIIHKTGLRTTELDRKNTRLNSSAPHDSLPTSSRIVVTMQDERSQQQTRAKAMRILKSRVYDYYQQKEQSAYDAKRKDAIGTGDRSERIRTYNYPQNRVTDHRI